MFDENNLLDLDWGRKFLQYSLNSKLQDMGMKMLSLKQQKLPNLEIRQDPFKEAWRERQRPIGADAAPAALYCVQQYLLKS